MVTRRTLGQGALALALATPALRAPRAQETELPNRPINVIVPWPPGGPTDAFARVLTQRMSTDTGRSFVVDNRGGAAGTIGMQAAARARPDGTTLVITPNSTFAIAHHIYPVQYSQERDFTGIGLLASSPLFIMVPGRAPYRTLQDYIAAARQPGHRMTYANSGVGATSHLAVELFMQTAGIEIQEVGYRGGGPALQAVLAGETGMLVLPTAAAMPLIASGDLRALAVTTRERSRYAPDVPTFQELGFAGFEVVEQIAMFAPAGTPEPLLRRFNAVAAAALRAPDMAPRWQSMGVTVEAQAIEAWPAFFAAENGKWRDFIRARNIRVQ
ncbi:Bug family tripartite tricarboxylate transporter substrate binding protein [Falsiroseomonas oryzae]|uniref:Bug family tripartite tricarboxylate transporter substrate binding protein n=1 Tax=Falsiroseomonas oryzae TaxID=2766473 RepID=UPI0022EB6DA9|nr:tripartite tricarboxylate transporter substrate binding protein [Roseomonas sp. MO-31]